MELQAAYHGHVTTPQSLMRSVERMQEEIDLWLKREREQGRDVTHIVATGISGQSLAWPLSMLLDLPVAVVRKHQENSHAGLYLVGSRDLRRYVVVDDLISSGDTIRHIWQTIHAQWRGYDVNDVRGPEPEMAAIFLAQQFGSTRSQLPWLGSQYSNDYVDHQPVPVFAI